MDHPLDPAYASARRLRDSGQPRARTSRLGSALVAVVLGWTTVVAVVELRRPDPGQARASIEREIDERGKVVDERLATVQALRGQIATLQARSLAAEGDDDLTRRTREGELAAGVTPVQGPGLELTLRDSARASDAAAQGDPRLDAPGQGRLLDADLQVVVNGLWAAGAEAISVNGRRLTALSAIRSAGEAILVDFKPLAPPYVVRALGDGAGLRSRFERGLGGAYLKELTDHYGVQAGMQVSTALTLPGAGDVELRYATAPAGGGARVSAAVTSSKATEVAR